MILKFSVFIVLLFIASSNCHDIVYEMMRYFETDGKNGTLSHHGRYSDSDIDFKEITDYINRTCLENGNEEDFWAFKRGMNRFEGCKLVVTNEMSLVERKNPHYAERWCEVYSQGFKPCLDNFAETYGRCLPQEDRAKLHLAVDIKHSIENAYCTNKGTYYNLKKENSYSCDGTKINYIIKDCFDLHDDQNITQLNSEEQCTKLSSLLECVVLKLRSNDSHLTRCDTKYCHLQIMYENCPRDELDYVGQPEIADLLKSSIQLAQKSSPCRLDTRGEDLNSASAAVQWVFARYLFGLDKHSDENRRPSTKDLVTMFTLILKDIGLPIRYLY